MVIFKNTKQLIAAVTNISVLTLATVLCEHYIESQGRPLDCSVCTVISVLLV